MLCAGWSAGHGWASLLGQNEAGIFKQRTLFCTSHYTHFNCVTENWISPWESWLLSKRNARRLLRRALNYSRRSPNDQREKKMLILSREQRCALSWVATKLRLTLKVMVYPNFVWKVARIYLSRNLPNNNTTLRAHLKEGCQEPVFFPDKCIYLILPSSVDKWHSESHWHLSIDGRLNFY